MTIQTMAQPSAASPIGQPGWPPQGQWTYADYLRLPDDGKRYEIIKGVLYVANAPSYEHQYAVGEIAFALRLFIKQHQSGVILAAPFEVHLAENTKPVQPDILFIPADQQPPAGTQVFVGVPALIVEVISPSSIRLDRTVKFDTYEQVGVAEYWLVDPKAHLVEVYTLARGEYALFGQYTGDEVITSAVLPGLQIKASSLFLPG
jgi:Uma2 family endonuclease